MDALRTRMIRGLASKQVLQPVGARCIATPAEALSYHPNHAGPSNTSTPAAGIGSAAEPQTARAERTLKRFWKTVNLQQDSSDGSWTVLLDKRTLKTPTGKVIALPREKRAAATVIAHEWDSQEQMLKPHSLPLTSLASRALEGLSDPPTRSQVVESLGRYLHTDTVCYTEGGKSNALTKLQDRHWRPLIDWVNKEFKTDVYAAEGQLFNRQSSETAQKLAGVISQYDPWRLAAFERAVMASKSYIIALGLAEGRLTADEAAMAAHVEVQSQIDRWGEVEDTHDVDHQDIRVRLGSSALLMSPLPVLQ